MITKISDEEWKDMPQKSKDLLKVRIQLEIANLLRELVELNKGKALDERSIHKGWEINEQLPSVGVKSNIREIKANRRPNTRKA